MFDHDKIMRMVQQLAAFLVRISDLEKNATATPLLLRGGSAIIATIALFSTVRKRINQVLCLRKLGPRS